MITINGTELNFDIADEKDAANYDKALEEYQAAVKKMEGMKSSDVIRHGNQMIRDFFYTATGKDVVSDVTNLREMMRFYREFIDAVKEQSDAVLEMVSSFKTEPSKRTDPNYPIQYMGKRPDRV